MHLNVDLLAPPDECHEAGHSVISNVRSCDPTEARETASAQAICHGMHREPVAG